MAYAVNLYFDPHTERLLTRVWKTFDDAGLPNIKQRTFRPHITLCIFEEIECQDCQCRISEISSHFELHELTLDHFGIFKNNDAVLFLAPTPSGDLLSAQKDIFHILTPFAQKPWVLYQPGRWVPHCTLANDLNDAQLIQAVGLSLSIPLPIKSRVSQIGIVEFDPIQPIFQVNIQKK